MSESYLRIVGKLSAYCEVDLILNNSRLEHNVFWSDMRKFLDGEDLVYGMVTVTVV